MFLIRTKGSIMYMHNLHLLILNIFRKQIQEINWQRKSEQTAAGGKLKQLEERYYNYTNDVF